MQVTERLSAEFLMMQVQLFFTPRLFSLLGLEKLASLLEWESCGLFSHPGPARELRHRVLDKA